MPEIPEKFILVFEELKKILQKYETELVLKTDNEEVYYLDGPYSEQFKRDLFFGSVTIKKRYVSYHLMPIYMYPELVDSLPESLKKRKQGKSCFNFTKVDETLFQALAELTQIGFERFKADHL